MKKSRVCGALSSFWKDLWISAKKAALLGQPLNFEVY
jgi:hypothetical protein